MAATARKCFHCSFQSFTKDVPHHSRVTFSDAVSRAPREAPMRRRWIAAALDSLLCVPRLQYGLALASSSSLSTNSLCTNVTTFPATFTPFQLFGAGRYKAASRDAVTRISCATH